MAIKYLLFIIFTWQLQAKICYIDPVIAKKNKTLSEYNKKQLDKFALFPPVRKESEEILQKLITAKSPMIYNWLKSRNLDPLNQTELVANEWFKYYSKMFVLATYPNNSEVVNKEIEKMFNDLLNKNFPKKHREELSKSFEVQKTNAIKTIENFPISSEDKKLLTERIENLKLYWPEQLSGSKFSKTPLEFFDWSLAYDPKNNEINIGLNSPHLDIHNFNVAILHEIAHSFDSCRWSANYKEAWPFAKIGECLRSNALVRDDSKLDLLLKEKKLSEEEYKFFKANPTCNNSKYPPIGIQSDQLPETFADWFSAETLDKKDIVKSLRSELCTDVIQNPGSSYLKNRDRFFKIYLANKKINQILNENSNYPACEFK